MNIRDVKKVIKALAEKKAPVTSCLWGKHGIAKSAAIGQIAEELNYQFIPLILSQREAVDLLGVPYHTFDEELKMSVTEYHPPRWFAKAVKQGKLILFLDELNRARPEVIKAAFELVNERRLNNMKLRDDVMIVVACNPDDGEGKYDVAQFDDAMIDRFMHIHVKADLGVFKEWAKESRSDGTKNIHSDILNFLNVAPEHAYKYEKSDENFPVTIKHSFRSWERAHYIHSLGLPRDLELECLSGVIGADVALAFLASIDARDNKPLTIEEIYEFSEESSNRLKRWTNDNNESRLDIIKETINNLHNAVKSESAVAIKYANNIMNLLLLLPDDLFVVAVKGIYERGQWANILLKNKDIKEKMLAYGNAVEQASVASGSSTPSRSNAPKRTP